MQDRISYHEMYMSIVDIISKRSLANRAKQGAILIKNNSIISYGYNGTPSGFDNNCEDENNVTKPEVLHAESNCLMKIACSTNSSEGSIMYITMSPCLECAKLIIQAKVKEVYYREPYRDMSGIKLLFKAGIKCECYLPENHIKHV